MSRNRAALQVKRKFAQNADRHILIDGEEASLEKMALKGRRLCVTTASRLRRSADAQAIVAGLLPRGKSPIKPD